MISYAAAVLIVIFGQISMMKPTFKRHTITAALPYTNGPVHIGHLAGVYVPADTYARYLRARGREVAFICGSDEHGVAIAIKAKKEGKTPQQIIDKYDQIIRKSFQDFGISFDNYSRTSAAIHHQTASEFFSVLSDKDIFDEKVSEQLYDPEAREFLADRFVTGICPHCSHSSAYGDICESCGSSLNATDLIDPKSTLSGATPVKKKTKHWFLPLEKYEGFIQEWILDQRKKDWKSNVYGQIKSWIENGLQARAVTRDLDWGIPVPLNGAEGKVLYVWFDAPIGYISSTKEWAAKEGVDWEPYWKDKDTQLVHFIGKDNIVFHCIIFPSMLHAHGDYILPDNVPANEFLNLEGDKISTSNNWAVWLHEYLEEFPDQQDSLRYVLTSNAPETKDNDFTWKEFQARNNGELVAIYGNFINRVAVLTQKYYEGNCPSGKNLTVLDLETLDTLPLLVQKMESAIEQYKFREASQQMMLIARLGNKYLAEQEPWKKIKTDPERVAAILHTAIQITAYLALYSSPILPYTAEKIKKCLGIEDLRWDSANQNFTSLIAEGQQIQSPGLLFEKIEDHAIELQRTKLQKTKETMNETPSSTANKEEIDFESFVKIELRVGKILSAKAVPKTEKLLEFEVDLGFETRTIVSGVALQFDPETLIDKKVTVLVNLAPRKIRGVYSQGMLLLAENSEGKLSFISPADPAMPPGSEIS